MTPERYARLCELFEAACDLAPDRRAAFLDGACPGDAQLRTEVEDMLAQDQAARAEQFLAPESLLLPPTLADEAPSPELAPGQRLGPYAVEEKVASGGMGTVYRAVRVEDYRQVVAVKVVRAGSNGPEALRRFQTERQSLAQLVHPNIARLLDGGTTPDGRPYLVMELIDGAPLDRHCQDRQLTSRHRAALVRDVARAVHHAHQRGVVHRDLKPSNVLVTGDGVVKVTDFGLARLHRPDSDAGQAAAETVAGAIMGTPGYMAPEQAEGRAHAAGPPADVWALGAVLYDLLTGRPPFRGENFLDTLEQVRRRDPVPPSRLSPGCPRDLETICLKCLQKGPQRRYPGASEVADDLQRFLDGKPVQARPVSVVERGWRWCRRNPALAGAAALAALMVVALVDVSVAFGVYQLRASDELRGALTEADDQRARAEERSAEAVLDRGLLLCQRDHVAHGVLLMARGLAMAPPEAPELRRVIRSNLAGWWRHLVPLRACLPHPDRVRALAFSPNGGRALTGCVDGSARLWDAATGRLVGTLAHAGGPVRAAAFSPDGRLAVTGGEDGAARLWDADSGGPHGPPLKHRYPLFAVTFSPDGRTLATGSGRTLYGEGEAHLWDLYTGQPRCRLAHGNVVRCLALSGDGKVVLTAGEDMAARLWDAETGEPRGGPLAHPGWVMAAVLDATGRTAVTATGGATARVWDLSAPSQKAPPVPLAHGGAIHCLALAPDGHSLLVGCDLGGEGEVRSWDLRTRALAGRPLTLPGPVHALLPSPDGAILHAATQARTTRWWRADRADRTSSALAHKEEVRAVAFSPDGKLVLTGGGGHFSKTGEAHLWRADNGEKVGTLVGHEGAVLGVAVSSDGRTLATSSMDGTARLWDARTLRACAAPLRQAHWVGSVAFSPDGRLLATGCEDGTLQLWDVATRRPARPPERFGSPVYALAFDRDRGRLLVGRMDGTARVYDTAAGHFVGPTLRHEDQVRAVAWAPDGLTALTGCGDKLARFWDVETGRAVRRALPHHAGVSAVAIGPDGRTALTACSATDVRPGEAWLWDAASGRPLTAPLVCAGSPTRAALGPDGRTVATAWSDGRARLWPVPVPLDGDPAEILRRAQVATGLELDEGGAVRVLDAEAWERRRGRTPGPTR